MSGIINKVKEALSGDSTNNSNTGATTNTTATTGTSGNTYTTGTTGTAEGVAGPHSSRLANTLDPRVDSDRDGSTRVGGTTTGMTGGDTYGSGTTGTTGYTGGDSYSSGNTGTTGYTGGDSYSSGNAGTTGYAGGDTYGSGTTGATGTTGAGPHTSSFLNKLDPRVDSTTGAMKTSNTSGTSGSTGMTGTTGTYTTGDNYTGSTGGMSSSTNAGSYATPGQGTAQNTAGPHDSDTLNKLDPRVDSDMDGSGTVGGNRTYGGSSKKDPLNAAHVPPSVLRQSLGDPVITHGNPEHNHQGRHGSVSHQEAHLQRGSEV